MCNQTLIILIIALFGLSSLVGIFLVMSKKKQGFGPYNMKVFGITIIVVAGALLVISDASAEQLLPFYSLLGAVAGYIFGLKNENGINSTTISSEKREESSTSNK